MSAKNLPSFMLNSANKTGQAMSSRDNADDSTLVSLELQEFARVYRSVSPLIIKATKSGNSRKELARLTRLQEKLLSQTIKEIGLDSENSLTNRSRYEISKSISELIAKAEGTKTLQKDLAYVSKKIKTNIHQFIAERTDIVSDRDTYLLADNNATNLKLSAVKPALDFYRTMKSLSLSSDSISIALKQQIEISIIMAKDICFNHDPKASLWDRELLFVSLISPCMDLVKDSWLSLLSKKYRQSSSPRIFGVEEIASELVLFRASIESQDMGHSEIIDQTVSDIARSYTPVLVFFTDLDIDYSLKSKLIEKQIKLLDKMLSEAWQSAIDGIKKELEELSESEVEEWINTEGSKPMSLTKVNSAFDMTRFKDSQSKNMSLSFSDKDLTGESFYRLIQAWGLTDTLCKIRK